MFNPARSINTTSTEKTPLKENLQTLSTSIKKSSFFSQRKLAIVTKTLKQHAAPIAGGFVASGTLMSAGIYILSGKYSLDKAVHDTSSEEYVTKNMLATVCLSFSIICLGFLIVLLKREMNQTAEEMPEYINTMGEDVPLESLV